MENGVGFRAVSEGFVQCTVLRWFAPGQPDTELSSGEEDHWGKWDVLGGIGGARKGNYEQRTKYFSITSSEGVDLGIYAATSPAEALDSLAREAGYRGQADAETTIGQKFTGSVREVTLSDLHPSYQEAMAWRAERLARRGEHDAD